MRYGFIFSAKWLRYIAIAVIFAIACALLANWQNSRREARNAEIKRIEANYGGQPQQLDASVPSASEQLPDDADWKHVTATGTYDAEHTMLVRNRPLSGQPGYFVVTPLKTEAGPVAVVRGWTASSSDPDPSFLPTPPSGTVTVDGWIRPAEEGDADDNTPGTVKQLDPKVMNGYEGGYTGLYLQVGAEDPQAQKSLQTLPKPSVDPGSHLSYTMQWILFGLMALGALIVALVRERKAIAEGKNEQNTDYVVLEKAAIAHGVRASGSRYGDGGRRVKSGRRDRSAEDDEDAALDSQGWG